MSGFHETINGSSQASAILFNKTNKSRRKKYCVMTSPALNKMDIYQAVVLDVGGNHSVDHVIIGRVHHIIPENLATIWNYPVICSIIKDNRTGFP